MIWGKFLWRVSRSRFGRHSWKLKRLQIGEESGLLLAHEYVVTGHFEKPRDVISAENRRQHASLVAGRCIFAGEIVEPAARSGDFDRLHEIAELIFRHRTKADLLPPTVYISQIAARHAWERNDTDICDLAPLPFYAEGGGPHLAGWTGLPPWRQSSPGGGGRFLGDAVDLNSIAMTAGKQRRDQAKKQWCTNRRLLP